MASAGTRGVENGVSAPGGTVDTVMLGSIMNRVRAQAMADPFSNPILLFALDLTLRIDRGEITLQRLEELVQALTWRRLPIAPSGWGVIWARPRSAANERRDYRHD